MVVVACAADNQIRALTGWLRSTTGSTGSLGRQGACPPYAHHVIVAWAKHQLFMSVQVALSMSQCAPHIHSPLRFVLDGCHVQGSVMCDVWARTWLLTDVKVCRALPLDGGVAVHVVGVVSVQRFASCQWRSPASYLFSVLGTLAGAPVVLPTVHIPAPFHSP